MFGAAGEGTILLDEIGDTSLAFQVKLLRVLEEGEYTPLGSTGPVHTNARIITATNRFITTPIAEELAVPHLLATDPEMTGQPLASA